MTEFTHRPVLLDECIAGLNIKPDGIYIDGTLGRAGHSREIARRLTTGRLICIDRDQAALDAAPARLAEWMDRVTLVHGNFARPGRRCMDRLDLPGADGMLFDLGVSSPQLDDASRGFSYMHDAPLDMRMDQSAPLTAYDGGEHLAPRGAAAYPVSLWRGEAAPVRSRRPLSRRRAEKPIETTLELVDVITLRHARFQPCGKSSIRPSARFQAIRIAVNDELSASGRICFRTRCPG